MDDVQEDIPHRSIFPSCFFSYSCPKCTISGKSHSQEAKEADRLAMAGTKAEVLMALDGDVDSASDMRQGFGGGRSSRWNGQRGGARPALLRLDRLFASQLPTNYDRWMETEEQYQVT